MPLFGIMTATRRMRVEGEAPGPGSYLARGLQTRKTEDLCCVPIKEVTLGERVRDRRKIKVKEEE